MELTPEEFQRAATIFAKACAMPDEERGSYLHEACAGDTNLRARVENLLKQDAQPAFSLESPPLGRVVSVEGAAMLAGAHGQSVHPQRIGEYEIVGILGEGGMGIVYEARQQRPARSVALKVLRPGIVSKAAQRRLQQEADILAKLQHRGIASVYEAGMAEYDGPGGQKLLRPYFLMELIRGRPLDEYVQRHKLSSRQRLRIFVEICEAVQHAHRKGIIHRDLKPGNILVDASGAPKILDFGVARITDADVRTTTLQTEVGQLIGTIAYMSPEQVSGNALELDTRSDVYTLGVIGYELLAGRLPQELGRVPVPEAVRLIRDGDPTPLCTVNKVFRGDLDVIFSKALEKERDRRYPAAAELAEDIRRHLRDEPIAARRPSALYNLRKFTRRHKTFTASIVLLFLTVTSFGVWMAFLYGVADSEALRARQTQAFLEKMLSSIDPTVAQGQDTKLLRGILDDAAEQVGDSLARQPEVEADIRNTIGLTYLAIGKANLAQPQLETALNLRRSFYGEENDSVAETTRLLAECAAKIGHRQQAVDLARQALDLRRKQFPGGDARLVDALQTLGWILSELAGNHAEAAPLLQESLEITERISGRENVRYAGGLQRLAILHWRMHESDLAEPLARESLEIKRKLYGADHPVVASAIDLLGQILTMRGDYHAAEPLIRESVEMHRRLYGEDHPMYATALNSWSTLLMRKGDLEAAEPIARKCLDLVTRLRGEDSHETAFALLNLANLIDRRGKYVEAERLYKVADQHFRRVFPQDHPYLEAPLTRLAEMFDKIEKPEAAEPLWRKVAGETRQIFPKGNANHAIAVSKAFGLGRCLLALGRCPEAEDLLLNCYGEVQEGATAQAVDKESLLESLVSLYEKCGPVENAEPFKALLEQADSLADSASAKAP